LGLLRAIEKFDRSGGASFSTYAASWIKAKIGLYLQQNQSMIRVPYNSKEQKHNFVSNYEQVVYAIDDKESHTETSQRMEFLQSLLDKIEQILLPLEFEIFLARYGLYEFRQLKFSNMYDESRQKYLTHKMNSFPDLERMFGLKASTLSSKMS
tara:strand:+ start:281 stop:739 length:459 start_codon:yes stop_codon:yes gene_type:complete